MQFLWQIVDEGVLGASKHVALGNEMLLHIMDNTADRAEALVRAKMVADFIARTRGYDTPVIGNSLSLLLAGIMKSPSTPKADFCVRRSRIGIAPPRNASEPWWRPRCAI